MYSPASFHRKANQTLCFEHFTHPKHLPVSVVRRVDCFVLLLLEAPRLFTFIPDVALLLRLVKCAADFGYESL